MRAPSAAAAAAALGAALLLQAGEAEAGQCRLYRTKNPDGSLPFCAGVINPQASYYTSGRFPDEILDRFALAIVLGFDPSGDLSQIDSDPKAQAMKSLLALLPGQLSARIKTAACMAVFPPCAPIDFTFMDAIDPTVLAGAGMEVEEAQNLVGQACTSAGFILSENRCFAPFPKLPCRAEVCHDPIAASNVADPAMPIVSGTFAPLLQAKMSSSDTLDLVKADFEAVLKRNTTISVGTSEQVLVSVNLLSLLGLTPSCGSDALLHFGNGTKFFPDVRQTALINNLKAHDFGGATCYNPSTGNEIDCEDLLDESDFTLGCSLADPDMKPSVARSYDIVESESVCAPFVRSKVNHDANVAHLLASVDASVQNDPDKSQCMFSHKLDLYRGIYYVPSFPGTGPLAPRSDPQLREVAHDNWDTTSCPRQREASPYFSNLDRTDNGLQQVLCKFGSYEGYNARDCIEARVKFADDAFPKFAPYRCRAAFLEMVCGQAHMKLEEKNLCLIPDALGGCELDDLTTATLQNRRAFTYFLPRFPAKSICRKVNEECEALGISEDCDAPINVTTCSGDPTILPAIGTAWGCTNSFNGIPKFPEQFQAFADVQSFGGGDFAKLAGQLGIPVAVLQSYFVTSVSQPTESASLHKSSQVTAELNELKDEFCECPFPLVIPDDPTALTVSPQSCCAIPCRGTMYKDTDMERFGQLQLILSGVGVLLMLFISVTWAIFPEKSKQYMTFWLSICSMMVSFGFFLMAVTSPGDSTEDNLCFDNSQGHTLKNGFSLCVLQGMMLIFFASAEVGWWAVQSIDLFRKLVLGKRNTEDSKVKYHMLAWTFPVCTTTALLVTRSFGYYAPSPYCLLDQEAETWVEWAAFYSYVAVLFVMGTVMMASVLAVIIRHAARTPALTNTSTSGGRGRVKYRVYRTPMLFVALFIFVWLNIFSFRLLVTVNETAYTDQGIAWITCLLTNFPFMSDPATNPSADNSMLLDPPAGTVGCGETQGGIPRGSLMMTFVVVMSQSILIFFVFGLHKDNYVLWLEFFGCRDPALRSQQGLTDPTMTRSKEPYSKEPYSNYSREDQRPVAPYQPGGSSYYGSSRNDESYHSNQNGPHPVPPPGRRNEY